MKTVAVLALIVACAAAVPAKPRIVGGDEAEEHSHPWQASLQLLSSGSYRHICGASIISDRWLITAAHCVDGSRASQMAVVVAEHDLNVDQVEVVHSLRTIKMHEDYRGSSAGFPNDIALLEVRDRIELTTRSAAISLPSRGMSFDGNTDCYITGWGLTQGSQDRTVLQELNADIRTQTSCRRAWGSSYINDGHICVENGNTGACNGDSGGPLACSVDGTWYLAGATSWGISGCQTRGYPSVYTRISEFSTWINQNMN